MRPELVAKYRHQRVPRYTSYPASPHFTDAVTVDTYRDWLRGANPCSALSLYLHLPFCKSMCWYCGCHTTVVRHEDPIWSYLAALSTELRTVAGLLPDGPVVRHIHFGGGTPTLLPVVGFRALMAELRSRFKIAPDAELAIEIDPRTLTAEMVEALGDVGVTRASLGVQSFDPDVQAAINRIQPFQMTEWAVNNLRAAGIRGINLDLIYGLPRQTVASCVETVRRAVGLNPDRLSIFGYAHMPGFKAHQGRIDTETLPDADERVAQLRAMEMAVMASGYVRVGMDHFARPDDAIAIAAETGTLRRNFQGYTTDASDMLLAFGASAIGKLPQGYVANILALPAYLKAIETDGLATARGYRMSLDDKLRATVIEALMCRFDVDLAKVAAAFDTSHEEIMPDARAIADLSSDGVAHLSGTRLVIPEAARPLVRSVAALFDRHLDPEGGRHSKAI